MMCKSFLKQIKALLAPFLHPLLFSLTESILWLSSNKNPKIRENSLIILRTDAIGDYLLFRAFLYELRSAYPRHHITFLGNSMYKNLFDALDSHTCDTSIWLDMPRFGKTFGLHIYKIRILRMLQQVSYTTLINPLHSRDWANCLLAKHIHALEKIAPQGDCINLAPKFKMRFDRIYTTLTPSTNKILFEFYRNEEFFEALLHKSLHTSPKLPKAPFALNNEKFKILPKPYALLFIGASAAYRKWSIEHFAEVGSYLANECGLNILICGGWAEKEEGERLTALIQKQIKSQNSQKIWNFCSRTSLVELGSCVYNGNLVISNETSCAHLAALLDTAVIAVSNGNHLGRFIPYPKEISDKYYPVFHHFIGEDPDKYEQLSNAFAYKSELNINEITPQEVIKKINHIQRSHNGIF